jgi:hypothetical protein
MANYNGGRMFNPGHHLIIEYGNSEDEEDWGEILDVNDLTEAEMRNMLRHWVDPRNRNGYQSCNFIIRRNGAEEGEFRLVRVYDDFKVVDAEGDVVRIEEEGEEKETLAEMLQRWGPSHYRLAIPLEDLKQRLLDVDQAGWVQTIEQAQAQRAGPLAAYFHCELGGEPPTSYWITDAEDHVLMGGILRK